MSEYNWIKSASDDQFWSLQYSEHPLLIIEALKGIPEATDLIMRGKKLSDKWTKIHESSFKNDYLLQGDLLELREYKYSVLKWTAERGDNAQKIVLRNPSDASAEAAILGNKTSIGCAPVSLYDHMIRELDFLLNEKTPQCVIALWLIDMGGHAETAVAWIDPVHEDLSKQAKKICKQFAALKEIAGYKKLINIAEIYERLVNENFEHYEWIDDEVSPKKNYNKLVSSMIEVQKTVTKFHLLLKNKMDKGELFTNMSPLYVLHTIRESVRAVHDLELLLV